MREKLELVSGRNVHVDRGFKKIEAANLRLRSQLRTRVVQFYQESGMTKRAASKALGLTQPRLHALLRGKVSDFPLDALVRIAVRAGFRVQVRVSHEKGDRHTR